jgi:hypothetical protein
MANLSGYARPTIISLSPIPVYEFLLAITLNSGKICELNLKVKKR